MKFYLIVGGEKIYVEEVVYRQYRRSKRREKYFHEQEQTHGVISIEEMYSPPAATSNVEAEFERSEILRQLWAALNKLSADEFEFVNLHYFENYSLKEIAEMNSTTYLRCWRKRKAILEKLRALIGEI